ncbi:uncharacterized protein LOC110020456 [Phalaenopsis equestris]|uniref:uncharacterized protein LOC110020456 n=1 Tax=Phalaenopsis equestris TaxID=78828 RepID=UPI0009E1EE9A|nr:uncharacterized protein LOC110020456 [Phalaenopsis equestris]
MSEAKGKMEEQKRGTSSHPPNISDMKPVTHEAYGGGMYGKDDVEDGGQGQMRKPPASETQSADGIWDRPAEPKHKPPPSTGDRDLDITGLSYIQ